MTTSSAEETLPETLGNGRYAVTRLLGRGAQGQTLEAVDKLQGCLVTIKRFRVRGARGWKDVELAEREAQVLSTLSHPRLPRYLAHFEEEGCLYLVTERIEGQSLDRIAGTQPRLGRACLLRLLKDLGEALEYLHSRAPPIIHRDIKPSNILRREDGSFVLVDFGSVRDRLRPEGGSTVVGTFGFMAPEQFQGRAVPATDIYGLGVTVLQLATGISPEQLPHRGLAIDVKASAGTLLPPAWVQLIERMVEPDPDERVVHLTAELHALEWQEAAHERSYASAPSMGDQHGRARTRAAPWSDGERGWPSGSSRVPPYDAPAWERGELGDLLSFIAQSPARKAVLVGLAIGRIVVHLALHAMLPAVLLLLSVFFGPAFRRAAGAVNHGGDLACAAMRRASLGIRAHSRRRRRGRHGRRARVDDRGPQRRTRVDSSSESERDSWPDSHASERRRHR